MPVSPLNSFLPAVYISPSHFQPPLCMNYICMVLSCFPVSSSLFNYITLLTYKYIFLLTFLSRMLQMICRRWKSPVRYRCGGRLKCGRNACGRVLLQIVLSRCRRCRSSCTHHFIMSTFFLSLQFLCNLPLVTVKMLEKSFPYLKLIEGSRSLQCVVVNSK
jgi:hypothetical protein